MKIEISTINEKGFLYTELSNHLKVQLESLKEKTEKVFKEGKTKLGAELSYHGNVPILKISTTDPYKAGQAQALLMSRQIIQIYCGLRRQFGESLSLITKFHRFKQQKKIIPKQYLDELQGIIDVINETLPEECIFTLDEVIVFQLSSDFPHELITKSERDVIIKKNLEELKSDVGCTTIITHDPKKGFILGHNLDWGNGFSLGTYTLVYVRKNKNGFSTIDVGFPGFIGILTGINSSGLSLSMNTCLEEKKFEGKGLCSALYNRMILKACQDIEAVTKFISKKNPLRSYHLMVATPLSWKGFHFYQKRDKNSTLDQHEISNPKSSDDYFVVDNAPVYSTSNSRKTQIFRAYDYAKYKIPLPLRDPEKLVSRGLELANQAGTLHKVIFIPAMNVMKLAFHRGYAGIRDFEVIDLKSLFK